MKPYFNLTLVKAILLVSLLPLLGMLLSFSVHVKNSHTHIVNAKKTIDEIYLVDLLSNVAHQHAIERGLTAGFLGSKGEKFFDKMKVQRQQSNSSAQSINMLKPDEIPNLDYQQVIKALEPLKISLKKKVETRDKVDRLAEDAQAFSVYSEINTKALEAIQAIIVNTEEPQIKLQLDNIVLLLWVKERAGQIRGKLNGIFTSGKLMPESYYTTKFYIDGEDNYIRNFLHTATEKQHKKFSQLELQPHWQSVTSAQTTFTKHTDTGTIKDPANGKWFSLASQRINDIDQLAHSIMLDIKQQAQNEHQQAIRNISIVALLISVLTIILIFIIVSVIRSVKKRVNVIHEIFSIIDKESDLTKRLSDSRQDELGKINRIFDKHLEAISSVFLQFKSISNEALKTTHKIIATAKKSNTNAQSQYQKTDKMNAAIANLTNTASDIASSMTGANSSIKNVVDNAQRSLEEAQQVNKIFAQITEEFTTNLSIIEKLDKQSQEIFTILDTISGIAEQTNLLALNAAIEAARAGEQGRGFAVVADEVRSLAQKTQESTANIREMIERLGENSQQALTSMKTSQALVEETEKRVNVSDESVAQVNAEIQTVQNMIHNITSIADAQVNVIGDISLNVQETKTLADDTCSNAIEVNSIIEELSKKFELLDMRIQSFKVE